MNTTTQIFNNTQGLTDFLGRVNTASGGLYALLILISVFLIVFLQQSRKFGYRPAFLSAIFLTTITAGILYAMGWISETLALAPAMLLAIGVAFLKK